MAEQSNDRLFDVGDRVRVTDDHADPAWHGKLGTVRARDGAAYKVHFDDPPEGFPHHGGWWHKNIAPAPPAESEVFGTQPDPLPETLPAGTLWHYDKGNNVTFTRPARLNGGYYFGDADTTMGSQRDVQVSPKRVLWETVRRPPAPPAIEQTAFKVGEWIEATGTDGGRYVGQVSGIIGTASDILWTDGTTTRWGASLLRPWQPQPGEMCEGDRFGFHGDTIRGPYERNDVDGAPIILIDTRRLPQRVEPSTLRPASTPPVRDETTAAGSAGPDDCCKCGHAGCPSCDAQPAAVDPSVYIDPITGESYNLAAWGVSPGGETDSEAVARRARVAIVHEHVREIGGTVTMTRLDAIEPGGKRRPNKGTLDRRIAASRAEIESGRAKGAERHPSDYDVDDAPECFSTSGWSGR